jgi:hypothetical protein
MSEYGIKRHFLFTGFDPILFKLDGTLIHVSIFLIIIT